MIRPRTWALGLVFACACGGEDRGHRLADAPPASTDAPVPVIDAAVDAAAPLPANEVTGGAHNVRGRRFAADVEIGHPIGQQPATGNGRRIEGNAAVKP